MCHLKSVGNAKDGYLYNYCLSPGNFVNHLNIQYVGKADKNPMKH